MEEELPFAVNSNSFKIPKLIKNESEPEKLSLPSRTQKDLSLDSADVDTSATGECSGHVRGTVSLEYGLPSRDGEYCDRKRGNTSTHSDSNSKHCIC